MLINHARVLVCIPHDPDVRLRAIITLRRASTSSPTSPRRVAAKEKEGRRNRYEIHGHLPLRESITQERTIAEVLDVLVVPPTKGREPAVMAARSKSRWRSMSSSNWRRATLPVVAPTRTLGRTRGATSRPRPT